ncbi:MAG: nitronate monooxygenase family protein [Lentisphaeria bacterium]
MSHLNDVPPLKIGDLEIKIPIIQGGMGVRVSAAELAAAVSNAGGLGVVASVGTGEEWPDRTIDYVTRSALSLKEMLEQAKSSTYNPIGVNIMCALNNYESLVKTSVAVGVAAIISGAGLPLKLPELVGESATKLIPVVSSGRATDLICRTWARRYQRLPDAFVVEGKMAGGHLGLKMEEAQSGEGADLEKVVQDVLQAVAPYASEKNIPVIAAGGIFDGKDIARFLRLGASGVQMGTRFVGTEECDAADEFKETYINCRKEDVVVIKSPIGLPLRVVRNEFVDRILRGERIDFKCQYQCLAPCNPAKTQYCVADAMVNAYRGNMKKGFATCGANAYRVNKIVPVRELMDELVVETAEELQSPSPENHS